MIRAYLDSHADPHDDKRALLNASFPIGQVVIVFRVDDEEVDEDHPDHVDDDRVEEDHHNLPLVALRQTVLLQDSSMRCMRRERRAGCSLLCQGIQWLRQRRPARRGMARSLPRPCFLSEGLVDQGPDCSSNLN